MLGRFVKWLGSVFAEHTVLQIIAPFPVAYLAGTGVQIMQGAEAMFDALPPLFWPILAILLLAVTVYPGFVLPFVKQARAKKKVYLAQVEDTYSQVSRIHKPETLNPHNPGNHQAMLELGQMAVDSMRPRLIHKYKNRKDQIVPEPIDVESAESLREWYDFLRKERVVAGGD